MAFIIEVLKDQEVLETIQAEVSARDVEYATINLIGAVHECAVSVMRKDDALNDLVREYDQPFELTGTGEVVDGKVHIHVTLGGEDVVVSGHLHRAMVRDFFVRAYVTDLPN